MSILASLKWSITERAEFRDIPRSIDGPPHKTAILKVLWEASECKDMVLQTEINVK